MKRWAILLAFAATGAEAGCLGQEPLAAARAFYEQHYDFYNAEPAAIEGLVGDRLGALLKQEYACIQGGEVCAFEADPWLAAQDGEAADVRYALEGENLVAVKYRFVLDDTGKGKPQTARLYLSKGGEGCWRVDDLVGPQGESLVKLLEQTYAESPPPAPSQPAAKKAY